MNGPDHFRQGEAELAVGCEVGCPHSGCAHEMAHVARAQAHFTAALVGATVHAAYGSMPAAGVSAWAEVLYEAAGGERGE